MQFFGLAVKVALVGTVWVGWTWAAAPFSLRAVSWLAAGIITALVAVEAHRAIRERRIRRMEAVLDAVAGQRSNVGAIGGPDSRGPLGID